MSSWREPVRLVRQPESGGNWKKGVVGPQATGNRWTPRLPGGFSRPAGKWFAIGGQNVEMIEQCEKGALKNGTRAVIE